MIKQSTTTDLNTRSTCYTNTHNKHMVTESKLR